MPPDPGREEVVEAVGLERRQPDHDEHHQDAQLDQHHDRVDPGRLAGAAHQQHRAHRDQHDRGQVDQAVGAVVGDGRVGQRVGDRRADRLVEQLVEVAAPAHGHRGRGDAVLQQDARGDDHGHELAEGVVGVGVRRPAHRDRAGHLGVAERREAGGQAGDQERHDRRPARRRARPPAARRRCRCRRWRRRRTWSAGTCRSCALSSGPSWGPFFAAMGFLRVSCSLSVADMGAPSRGRSLKLVPQVGAATVPGLPASA